MKKKYVRAIVVGLYFLAWIAITGVILAWYAQIATVWAFGRYQLPDNPELMAFAYPFMFGCVLAAYVLVMLACAIVQPFLSQKDDDKLPKPLLVMVKIIRGFLVELCMISVLALYAYVAMAWLAGQHGLIASNRTANTMWWLFLFIIALAVYLVMWVVRSMLQAAQGKGTVAR
jgi:hypothetical protein